jgi:rod shape-determining protein MreD
VGFLTVAFVVLAVLVIQSTLVPLIRIGGIAPDVLLAYMIIWCMHHDRSQGVILGFCGGMLHDLMGGGTLGVYALSKSLACYAACSLPRSKYSHDFSLVGIMLFLAIFIHQLIHTLFVSREAAAGFLSLFFRYGVPSMLYTLLFGMSAYGLIQVIRSRKRTR